MTLIWMLLEKLAGLHDEHIDKHPIYTNFIAIPAIAIYVFSLLDKRKKFYKGAMTYKQGFISGLVITAIVTVLSPLSQYITPTIITPEYDQVFCRNRKDDSGSCRRILTLITIYLRLLSEHP